MVKDDLSDADFLKREVLASVREYEANPNDVYTFEEVKASMRKLFAKAKEEELAHAKRAA